MSRTKTIVIIAALGFAGWIVWQQLRPSTPITFSMHDFNQACEAHEEDCEILIAAMEDGYRTALERVLAARFKDGASAGPLFGAKNPYCVHPDMTYADARKLFESTKYPGEPRTYYHAADTMIRIFSLVSICPDGVSYIGKFHASRPLQLLRVREVHALCKASEERCHTLFRAMVTAKEVGTALGLAVSGRPQDRNKRIHLSDFNFARHDYSAARSIPYCIVYDEHLLKLVRKFREHELQSYSSSDTLIDKFNYLVRYNGGPGCP